MPISDYPRGADLPLINANALSRLRSRPRTVYEAFGLRLSSEIPLPELPIAAAVTGSPQELPGAAASGGSSQSFPVSTASSGIPQRLPIAAESPEGPQADVDIAIADPHELWRELQQAGYNFVRVGNRFLFLIPETAIYCIEDGERISVAPLAGADADKVRVYLLGTCMGALMMLRRTLPLHGSAVVIDGRAYAFLGDSGVGKSTLAAALVHRGYTFLSDDVIAATLGQRVTDDAVAAQPGHRDRLPPLVMPAYPQQKLWRASIDGLGLLSGHYRPVYRETEKFAIPVPESAVFGGKPVPLGGIIELVKAAPGTAAVRPRQLSALERLKTLQLHTYRNMLICRLGLERWHFRITADIAAQVPMFRLPRPIEGFTAHRLAAAIIRIARKENR